MRYYIVTPVYGSVVPILDDGTGPEEFGADVIEVEAPTKREAIRLGVLAMLKGNRREFSWCRDQRADGCNPFAGVRAETFWSEEECSTAARSTEQPASS